MGVRDDLHIALLLGDGSRYIPSLFPLKAIPDMAPKANADSQPEQGRHKEFIRATFLMLEGLRDRFYFGTACSAEHVVVVLFFAQFQPN